MIFPYHNRNYDPFRCPDPIVASVSVSSTSVVVRVSVPFPFSIAVSISGRFSLERTRTRARSVVGTTVVPPITFPAVVARRVTTSISIIEAAETFVSSISASKVVSEMHCRVKKYCEPLFSLIPSCSFFSLVSKERVKLACLDTFNNCSYRSLIFCSTSGTFSCKRAQSSLSNFLLSSSLPRPPSRLRSILSRSSLSLLALIVPDQDLILRLQLVPLTDIVNRLTHPPILDLLDFSEHLQEEEKINIARRL